MIENLRFTVKIALLAISLIIVSFSSMLYQTNNFLNATEKYNNFVNQDDRSVIMLARITDKVNALLYATRRIADPGNAKVLYPIINHFHYDESETLLFFKTLYQTDPELEKTVAPLEERYKNLQDLMDKVVTIVQGNNVPSSDILANLDNEGIKLAIDVGLLEAKRLNNVEVDSEKLKKNITHSTHDVAIISLSILFIVSFISLYMSKKNIVGPLHIVRNRMLSIAKGELNAPVPCLSRGDEVGDMAKALHNIQSSLQDAKLSEERQVREREDAAHERALILERREQEAEEERKVANAIRKGLAFLAEGNMSYQIEEEFPERFQVMKTDFNTSGTKLKQTIAAVHRGIVAIGSGAKEIAAASEDMSRRTEQQAANIEESSVALSRVVEMVRSSANSATQAAQVTDEARQGAESSGSIVTSAVQAIGEIETRFTEINQVIGLIDDIAFQTNLLALNAGIEAARAGEAGRGFSVVATEIRNLAQRSADGARQVKMLVSNSNVFVTDGVRLVREAGSALQAIFKQMNDIDHLVAAIAEASGGQSLALDEINLSVSEMTTTTQQNAALVEQNTTAVSSLDQEVASLADQIEFFNTGENTQIKKIFTPAVAQWDSRKRVKEDAGWDDFR